MTDAFLGFQNVTWDKKRNTAKYDLKMWWQHTGNPMKEREREREMEANWRRGKAKKQPSAFHGMFPWHASMRYLSCVLDLDFIFFQAVWVAGSKRFCRTRLHSSARASQIKSLSQSGLILSHLSLFCLWDFSGFDPLSTLAPNIQICTIWGLRLCIMHYAFV